MEPPHEAEPLRVAFRHFYPNFSPQTFWLPILRRVCETPVALASAHQADLIFTSVFEDFWSIWHRRLFSRRTSPRVPEPARRVLSSAKQIWITGENVRAPLSGYDLTLSFDTDDYGETNLYFPYLLENLNWDTHQEHNSSQLLNLRGAPKLSPIAAARPRVSSVSGRTGFVCAFVGNPEPVRMRAIDSLRKYGEVEVFGSAVGRPAAQKLAIAANFRFMLAFENDVYPGYVTEKPLEAYGCGAVPLWRGLDSAQILNPQAMINAMDYESLSDFAEQVAFVDSNPNKMDAMVQQPLLASIPSLEPLETALTKLASQALSGRRTVLP